jgi:hypothetical protein
MIAGFKRKVTGNRHFFIMHLKTPRYAGEFKEGGVSSDKVAVLCLNLKLILSSSSSKGER